MGHTKSNYIGYIQAVISFLIIMCVFLPFLILNLGVDNHSYGFDYYYEKFSLFKLIKEVLDNDDIMHIGVIFVIFISLQIVNILTQLKKNNAFIPIFAGLFGIISIFISFNSLNDYFDNLGNSYYGTRCSCSTDEGFGSFVIFALAALQVTVQLIAILYKKIKKEKMPAISTASSFLYNSSASQSKSEIPTYVQPQACPQTTEAESDSELVALRAEAERLKKLQEAREKTEKESLEEELRQLRAKAEQMERERIERERLERERIEKEELRKEIARLKEMLGNNGNIS